MPTSDHILAELKTLHPRLIDLSLGRIEALLAKLGNPEQRLPPVIHVAGTNGKGSVVAFLKAMLEAAGKRVHVYTSPHLVRFHERIAIAGADGKARPIGEDELVERLRDAQRVNAGAPITQFEITTAAALQAFADHPADALILEVGLGGRLDATNVVARPALSVITPIAIDHADKLGDTLAKIAWEKAGILKPGVTAVISAQPGEALEAITAHAKSVSTPLFVWGSDYEAFEQRGRLVYQSAERLMDLPLPALMGRHQITNAGTAIAAALHLKPLGLADSGCHRARPDRGALAGAHAASGQRAAVTAARAGLRAVARRRPQPGRRPGHRPDARRHGGALAQAGRPRARHDGQQGHAALPCPLQRAGAPHRHRADLRCARGSA